MIEGRTMTRGQYIRTPEWKEKASKRNTEKNNPAYKHGAYSKQATEKRIQDMLEAKQKIINETYQNKEWLFQKYCIEKNPIQEIAKKCKVEFETIWTSLKQLGIPRISMVGRQYWYAWVESEKHAKAKQEKAFKRLMKNGKDKTKGKVAIPKIDRYKTLINQQS